MARLKDKVCIITGASSGIGAAAAEAFAAEWAAAYKNSDKVWLYVDVTGLDALQNDMTVTPVLYVKDQTSVWTDSLTYTVN